MVSITISPLGFELGPIKRRYCRLADASIAPSQKPIERTWERSWVSIVFQYVKIRRLSKQLCTIIALIHVESNK